MSIFDKNYTNDSGSTDLGMSLRIGVDEVDKMHGELARLIEALDDDPHALISSESATVLLASLQNALAREFEIEEQLMVRNKIPEHQLDEHVSEHTALLTLVVEASLEAMSQDQVTSRQLYGTIKERVLAHTNTHDLRLI
jgi:hemerythrin-like metal-binding protein